MGLRPVSVAVTVVPVPAADGTVCIWVTGETSVQPYTTKLSSSEDWSVQRSTKESAVVPGVTTRPVGDTTTGPAGIAGLVVALATTVADLHDLGVAHTRLTAEHVLLDHAGRPVLCGFGDAVVAADTGPLPVAVRAVDVAALGSLLRRLVTAADPGDGGWEPIPARRFGGMAGIPKRASACEQALIGAAWYPGTVERACEALAKDFTPLSDFRASKEYRLLTAQNLLRKFFLELQSPEVETRVTAYV